MASTTVPQHEPQVTTPLPQELESEPVSPRSRSPTRPKGSAAAGSSIPLSTCPVGPLGVSMASTTAPQHEPQVATRLPQELESEPPSLRSRSPTRPAGSAAAGSSIPLSTCPVGPQGASMASAAVPHPRNQNIPRSPRPLRPIGSFPGTNSSPTPTTLEPSPWSLHHPHPKYCSRNT